jgi:hypothetical protein
MPRLSPLELIENFDRLPDDAIVPDVVARILLNDSERSFRLRPPVPRIPIGPQRGGRRVGDIRALVRNAAKKVGTRDAKHASVREIHSRP